MTFPGGNGDGSLFYPGEAGPLPSLRLYRIRDGIEDYDLLCLAREAVRQSQRSNASDTTPDHVLDALDPSGWFESFQDWNANPRCYERRRDVLLRYLASLAQ